MVNKPLRPAICWGGVALGGWAPFIRMKQGSTHSIVVGIFHLPFMRFLLRGLRDVFPKFHKMNF